MDNGGSPIDWQARAQKAEAAHDELLTLFHFQAGQLCKLGTDHDELLDLFHAQAGELSKLGTDVSLLLRAVDRSSEPIRDERVIRYLDRLREKVSLRQIEPGGA